MKDYNAFVTSLRLAPPLSARKAPAGNRSNYKSTRERVDSKGLYGRYRLRVMGPWANDFYVARHFRLSLLNIFYCDIFHRSI